MKSMTGFGRVETNTKLGRLVVEVSSLNNRFVDFSFKGPRQFSPLEAKVRELVAAELSRGKVTVSIGFEESEIPADKSVINKKMAAAYYKQLRAFQKEMKIPGDITVADLLILPEVAKPEQMEIDYEQYWKVLEPILGKALKQLIAMRKREGAAMAADMKKILESMVVQVKEVERKTPASVEEYRQRLTDRINEILENKVHNSVRLEEEIALFADRSDVTEECSRLNSHVEEFRRTVKLTEPIGKRLNFVLQEMNREANTIGSKCADYSISSTVILLKEEVEKLRELVLTVE